MRFNVLIMVAVLVLVSAVLQGQRPARSRQKEQSITEKLAATAPALVPAFQRATEAMDKGDYPQAVLLYRRVVEQAPTCSPALRRLGHSLAELGQTEEALAMLERAVNVERSPENLATLAEVLAYPGQQKLATEAQKARALVLVKEANERFQGVDDASYALLMAQMALDRKSESEYRQATAILVRTYPELMATHYYHAILLAMDGSYVAAENEIKRAEQMGLPREAVEEFLATGVHSRATAWRWAYYALFLVAAWAAGLFLLFVAGKLFSKLTLFFIRLSDPNARTNTAEQILRRSYRALINVAGFYYYVSIPVVIFLVLAVTASIVYGFWMIGRIPIKLVGILVIGALVTVYMMVSSLFVKVVSGDPGRGLTRDEAPGLWELTREVADRLITRPVDEIRIVPGTEMAVYERGTYRERRRDLAQRILVMGFGLLPDFRQNSFRAVLAHEYGHLSHRDTAGGDVALRVSQDMMKFACAMAYAGQAVWWNIAFHFLRVYDFLFRRISHGAIRLQEILADRAAVQIYGAANFQEGLRHVVRRQIEFAHLADNEIQQASKAGRTLNNLYAMECPREGAVEDEVNEALNRPSSEDDTHPSPVDRFQLASHVACYAEQPAAGVMLDLFANREAIAEEMCTQIEQLVKAAAA